MTKPSKNERTKECWRETYGKCSSLEQVIYKALHSRQSKAETADKQVKRKRMDKHRTSRQRTVNHVPLIEAKETAARLENFLQNATRGQAYPTIQSIAQHDELYKQFLVVLPQMEHARSSYVFTGDTLVPVAPLSASFPEHFVMRTKERRGWWTEQNHVANVAFIKRFIGWLKLGAPLETFPRHGAKRCQSKKNP